MAERIDHHIRIILYHRPNHVFREVWARGCNPQLNPDESGTRFPQDTSSPLTFPPNKKYTCPYRLVICLLYLR